MRNTQLIAPFDGVVTRVNIKANEQVNSALPAIVVTDLDNLQMTVLVDELDVREVAVGQPVRIRVDALPDNELAGTVTEIAPTADNVSGVIAYPVTIVPEVDGAPVRIGMSGTTFITTAEVNDVVLLPNRFIQLDRETDRAYVYKMIDGVPVLQEVELGLRNDASAKFWPAWTMATKWRSSRAAVKMPCAGRSLGVSSGGRSWRRSAGHCRARHHQGLSNG